MKKKIYSGLVCLTLMLASMPIMAMGAEANGEEYVPLRSTFESMGYRVDWSQDNPEDITIVRDDFPITFTDNRAELTADEGAFAISQAVYIDQGVAYLPTDGIALCNDLYRYHLAILDAIEAEEDERMPLQAIDATADQVLLCTWHKYPDSYITGSEMTLQYGDVWVFTADEILAWGKENSTQEDMTLRLEQLIGLPPQKGNTHFSLLWANPADIYRPSADAEIDDTVAELTFPADAAQEHIDWYNGNMKYSYQPHKYPWTRLGYTYDWNEESGEYGLSEFIIRDGAPVKVEGTYSNDEFIALFTAE